MKHHFFKDYLLIQLKAHKKLLPTVMLFTLLLSAACLLLAHSLSSLDSSDEDAAKIRFGIVGDTEEPYLKLVISALQHLDPSRYAISFETLSEEDAQKQLKDSTLNAYFIIPTGFIESISYGEPAKITFVRLQYATGLGSALLEEFMEIISDLLVETQNSTYGMRRVFQSVTPTADTEAATDIDNATEAFNVAYFDLVLNRDTLYEIETVSAYRSASLSEYYLCALLLIFLLLWGICCSSLCSNRSQALSTLLVSRGQSYASQVFAEYISYYALLFCNLTVTAVLFTLPMKSTDLSFISLLPTLLLIAAMTSSLQLLLYELSQNKVSAILLQFLSALVLGYLSGCFYPVSFFPEQLQHLSSALPTGIALQYLIDSLLMKTDSVQVLLLLAYSILFLTLTMLVRRLKCRKGAVL